MPSKHADDFSLDTVELAQCAQINLENLAKMAPAVAQHPMFQIAKSQLVALVERLEAESTQ